MKKQTNFKTGIMGIFGLLAVIIGTGCDIDSHIGAGRARITYQKGETTFDGFDYIMVVNCTVMNEGKAGWFNVYSRVHQNGHSERGQSVHLGSGESKSLQFRFPELSFFGEASQYQVWVKRVSVTESSADSKTAAVGPSPSSSWWAEHWYWVVGIVLFFVACGVFGETDREEVYNMTKSELRDECRRMGLVTYGKKDDLAERIIESRC